jgi:hypothetical protein
LAAHLAFIAAASCARRSGERFSFLFAFLAACFFASAIRAAAARAKDFLAAFNTFTASAASRPRFSSVSFSGPSRRRFSSRLIFFFKSFEKLKLKKLLMCVVYADVGRSLSISRQPDFYIGICLIGRFRLGDSL